MADKREIQNFYDDFKAGGFAKYTSAYEHRSRLISIYELADLKNGELVLEVGCGIGWMTMKYASTAEINIIGVDISGESILEARNKAIEKDINNLAFAIMDAEELGFQNVVGRVFPLHITEVGDFVYDPAYHNKIYNGKVE